MIPSDTLDFNNVNLIFTLKSGFICVTFLISTWQMFYEWKRNETTVKMFIWGYYIKCIIIPIICVGVISGYIFSSVKLWESWYFSFNIVYVVMIASDVPGYLINVRPYIKSFKRIRRKKQRLLELKII